MDLEEVLGSLRGPAGSRVMVTLGSSQDPGSLHSLFLERRPLPQPPIKQVDLVLALGACNGPGQHEQQLSCKLQASLEKLSIAEIFFTSMVGRM